METLNTLLLGIIQGLTEFLPVSSSGHLILAQTFMGADAIPNAESNMLLEVMLHLATGIAVLFVFRKDIMGIIGGCFSSNALTRKNSLTYSGWVILATVPAAAVGILFKDSINVLFDTSGGKTAAYIAASMLFVTAALLMLSSIKGGRPGAAAPADASAVSANNGGGATGQNSIFGSGGLTLVRVIIIGLMQAIAIMPGISRSGSTIAIALLIGVSREESGRFSFMLALPAIFGAALLEARHIESFNSIMTASVWTGFIASFIVGIIALKLLLTFIKKGKLHYFGYYCAAAAVVSLTCLTFVV